MPTALQAFLAPPMAIAGREREDATLLATARAADVLRKPRQALRRARGREPPVLDAAAYAAACGLPVDPDPAAWAGVFAARNELVERWLWLVHLTAGRLFASPGALPSMTLADMIQEGACGLMCAVERYDARRGGAFGMYAYFAIKHAILRAAENQRGPIRLPVHVHNKLSRLRKARALLEMAGRSRAVEEVAQEAGVAIEEARLYIERSRSTRSLDAPLLAGKAATLYEMVADPADSARQVEIACAKEKLAQCVSAADLGELERKVVTLKYGLANGVERRRSDVSRMLKVEEHKLRRAERNALKKLRRELSDDTTPWAELLA